MAAEVQSNQAKNDLGIDVVKLGHETHGVPDTSARQRSPGKQTVVFGEKTGGYLERQRQHNGKDGQYTERIVTRGATGGSAASKTDVNQTNRVKSRTGFVTNRRRADKPPQIPKKEANPRSCSRNKSATEWSRKIEVPHTTRQ